MDETLAQRETAVQHLEVGAKAALLKAITDLIPAFRDHGAHQRASELRELAQAYSLIVGAP